MERSNEKCKQCYYSSIIKWMDGKHTICQYILIEHRERLCEGGENCNKFKPKGEQRQDNFFEKTMKEEIKLAKSKRLHTI